MFRAVLDTNVVISGLFWNGTPHQVLMLARSGKISGLTSEAMLEELHDVITRPTRPFRLAPDEWLKIEKEIRVYLHVVTTGTLPNILADSGDDAVLACARDGNATHIVTGDPNLLTLGHFGGSVVLNPRAFADLLPL